MPVPVRSRSSGLVPVVLVLLIVGLAGPAWADGWRHRGGFGGEVFFEPRFDRPPPPREAYYEPRPRRPPPPAGYYYPPPPPAYYPPPPPPPRIIYVAPPPPQAVSYGAPPPPPEPARSQPVASVAPPLVAMASNEVSGLPPDISAASLP